MSSAATWRGEHPSDSISPFKGESPLHAISALTSPERILVDSAHTWHIGTLGFGYCSVTSLFAFLVL